MVINEDILNELDMLMILQICSDACEREKTEMFEDILTECILSGMDEEQSELKDESSGNSSL